MTCVQRRSSRTTFSRQTGVPEYLHCPRANVMFSKQALCKHKFDHIYLGIYQATSFNCATSQMLRNDASCPGNVRFALGQTQCSRNRPCANINLTTSYKLQLCNEPNVEESCLVPGKCSICPRADAMFSKQALCKHKFDHIYLGIYHATSFDCATSQMLGNHASCPGKVFL